MSGLGITLFALPTMSWRIEIRGYTGAMQTGNDTARGLLIGTAYRVFDDGLVLEMRAFAFEMFVRDAD